MEKRDKRKGSCLRERCDKATAPAYTKLTARVTPTAATAWYNGGGYPVAKSLHTISGHTLDKNSGGKNE